jgi:hypothetical protein
VTGLLILFPKRATTFELNLSSSKKEGDENRTGHALTAAVFAASPTHSI